MARKTDMAYLKKELELFVQRYAEGAVKAAKKDLTEKATSYMMRYYDDLEPKKYVRTFNLKNNAITSVYKIEGKTYSGGVKIDAEKMNDYTRLTPISGLLRRSLRGLENSRFSSYPRTTTLGVLNKFLDGSHYRNQTRSANVRKELTEYSVNENNVSRWMKAGEKHALSYSYKYIMKAANR